MRAASPAERFAGARGNHPAGPQPGTSRQYWQPAWRTP
jgi:hypothetical protein